MVLDPSATHQTYAQCITTGTLALIAVILRFIARFKSGAGLAADDYFALFALCMFWAYNIVTIWSMFATSTVRYCEYSDRPRYQFRRGRCLRSPYATAHNYTNAEDALIASNLWIVLQLSCAIICACIPVYRPIMPELTVFKSSIAPLSSLLGRHSSMSSRQRPASVKIHGSEKMIPQPVPTFRAKYEGYEEYTDIGDQVALAGLPSGAGHFGGKERAAPEEMRLKNMV
ncbi:MAG: hypothetical protein Q9160_005996 [Pyrenula sp. 1 TL-2023]